MQGFIEYLQNLLADHGWDPVYVTLTVRAIGLTVLILLAWLVDLLTKRVVLRVVSGVVRRTSGQWDDAFLEAGVFTRLCHLAPVLVFHAFAGDVLGETPEMTALLDTVVTIYLVVVWLLIGSAVLNSIQVLVSRSSFGTRMPVKGFGQAVKLVGALFGAIYILSVLLDKTPVYIFSGMGALTAVLLLIFKDALLGFVAGIQLSVNQMVMIGDWIEMPNANADGFVIDVSLTTVKVQNWDKTITTIPPYSLISESFKNWRGMFESGGRRIKRAIHVDLQTVRFADETMLARWRQMRLLQGYLNDKLVEIETENTQLGVSLGVLGNGRRLTNLGTFRAYCVAYLRDHAGINQEMLLIVRQLAPTEHGLPLELYVFTKDVSWAVHEAVQSDIFDHLLAMVTQFDLRVFQQPAGHDFKSLAGPRERDDALPAKPITIES